MVYYGNVKTWKMQDSCYGQAGHVVYCSVVLASTLVNGSLLRQSSCARSVHSGISFVAHL